jgi:hypothetical protein
VKDGKNRKGSGCEERKKNKKGVGEKHLSWVVPSVSVENTIKGNRTRGHADMTGSTNLSLAVSNLN